MMNRTTERYKKLMKVMSPCSKDMYFKDEIQSELTALKNVIVNCTYNVEHAENMRLGLEDVVKHLGDKNSKRGNLADEYLLRLETECKEFDTILGREVAGNTGELQAFRSLETVKSDHIIFQNLELSNGENRGELDAVVITSKAIFLIEVKNSGHDMVIDAKGNYFRARGYMTMDYNIGEKVNNKEYLLRNALEEQMKKAGKKLNIVNYVVFANSKINVTNRYKYLTSCFLSQLPHLIDDYAGNDIYTTEDLLLMKETIQKAEDKKAYPLGFNVKQLKEDFAMAMAVLEIPVFEEGVIEDVSEGGRVVYTKNRNEKYSINNNAMKFWGMAAAFVLTVATAVTIRKHTK